ncbi:hypothetical protein K6119_12830 [Paracrocinitomix mangrovi]|uniref:hypothetical protein n=1 Tax=Paracrocinitomix mangrovi TaxID=2862509 RepID=UPI001C8D3E29|nr:hypothetical protein [Paracrocinitomix mangrovi]UKN00615.1 hypothetical protein K6119_12830 [Paracrocinitomix mangrovi]
MKKTLIAGTFAGALLLASCTDHEVIPPPVPIVDLACLCEGTITTQNGDSTFTYSDTCTYSSTKTINTGTQSNAQYQTQILNSGMNQGWEVEMRSLYWDDDGSNNPTSTEWQAYFNGNTQPTYAPDVAADGVIVRWTDSNGAVWVSDTGQVCLSNFTYNLFTYDSDTTGEYMEFDAVLNGHLMNSDYTLDSTICFSNVHIKSAFRRE